MEYKTLSSIMEMPARESLGIIARVAPCLSRVCRRSGIIGIAVSLAQGGTDNQAKAAEELATAVLETCLGDCLDDVAEVLAAVNGLSIDELLDGCTTAELVDMVKALVGDPGFFTSARELTD